MTSGPGLAETLKAGEQVGVSERAISWNHQNHLSPAPQSDMCSSPHQRTRMVPLSPVLAMFRNPLIHFVPMLHFKENIWCLVKPVFLKVWSADHLCGEPLKSSLKCRFLAQIPRSAHRFQVRISREDLTTSVFFK